MPGRPNHPPDNIGAALAAAESVDASGSEFLTSVAVAYQVQVGLSDVAPVRAKGFDHATQGAYAAAAGVAKALRLPPEQIANAIAIAGTANNALRVTRTGNLSNWKGLAYPNTAKEATFAALLAGRGITGPEEVEWISALCFLTIAFSTASRSSMAQSISKAPAIDSLNPLLPSNMQSALDAALDIRQQDGFHASAVNKVRLRTFEVAYSIIGGGEEGSKHTIRAKEEADHSLPYLIAVALLDGQVGPQQYPANRILADDVQDLLAKVEVVPDAGLTEKFPALLPADLQVELVDGPHSPRHETTTKGSSPTRWAGRPHG